MKATHIVGIVLIGIAIATIFATVYKTDPYSSFKEADQDQGEIVQVIGVLSPGKEIYYKPEIDPNFLSFYMLDEENTEKYIIHYDAKPQDFEKLDNIVVTGYSTDTAFIANEILLKCPSRYQDDEKPE